MWNKITGKPQGFAYIEFADSEAVENALLLNESLFKGRELKARNQGGEDEGRPGKGLLINLAAASLCTPWW